MTRARPRRLTWKRWLLAGLILVLLLPVALILPLRWSAVDSTAFMRRTAARVGPVDQTWVPAASIAPCLGISVVAAEDQRFPGHHGFDLDAIRSALDSASGRGASTISQQVVKNLYLWPDRSWWRKGLEAWLTVYLELLLPKERILGIYQNIAQFGPTVFGAEAAARTYFGKPAARLVSEECALLAAVLPSPARLHVARPSAYVRERAAWIQDQARRLGGPAYVAPGRRPAP